MFQRVPPRLSAALQAVFVTILWATSWVLIKIGLTDIPPLLFAGLRYSLGAVVLLTIYWRSPNRIAPQQITKSTWTLLAVYGIIYYTFGQGTQFISLKFLPAVTTNLILGNIPIAVAILSIIVLKEVPTKFQWGGIALSLTGILLYFLPVQVVPAQWPGILAALIGVLTNAGASILGRDLNRKGELPALWITLISMGIGAPLMLAIGLSTAPLPSISLANWLIIAWLAVVNTAFAFTLWNHTLKTLTATESSMINTLMIVEIPFLATLFLGERVTGKELAGLVLVMAGIALVQLSTLKIRS